MPLDNNQGSETPATPRNHKAASFSAAKQHAANTQFRSITSDDEGSEFAARMAARGSWFEQTHQGLSDRFVAQWGRTRIAYSTGIGWLFYENGKWEVDEDNTIALCRMSDTVRLAALEVHFLENDVSMKDGKNIREQRRKWATKMQSAREMKNALMLAASDPSCKIPKTAFDNDPDTLNTTNGIVDLKTAVNREHEPSAYLRLQTAARAQVGHSDITRDNYHCPKWEQFLFEVFDGDQDLINYVQRMVGYWITGRTSEHAFWVLVGSGANGKSTFLNVIKWIMGDYAVVAARGTFLKKIRSEGATPDISDLKDARLVMSGELQENTILDESLIKSLAVGSSMRSRQLYKGNSEFKSRCKIVLECNSLPNLDGGDGGNKRRARIIRFNQEFKWPDVAGPDDKIRVPDLDIKLIEEEGNGIHRWAIEGSLLWHVEDGLNTPNNVILETEDYLESIDPIGHFLEDCCEIDPTAREKKSDVFKRFERWSSLDSGVEISAKSFGTKLRDRKGIHSIRDSSARYWKGIRLKTQLKSQGTA